MKTELLLSLYRKYGIASLTFGAIHDKLGDVYEDYCVTILSTPNYLNELKMYGCPRSFESDILMNLLNCYGINDYKRIHSIVATNDVPHRTTGGNSKTDIIATVRMINGNSFILPISCKQSTVAKVALAEFDVDTICREMDITNPRLRALLMKHQIDCSAINFTSSEKTELFQLMEPIRHDFVRWVLTGSPRISDNVCIPNSIIKFSLTPPKDRYNISVASGDFDLISYRAMPIEDYVNEIIYNKNGSVKTGGFGTGLSWTYATGSKGQKMQFKG